MSECNPAAADLSLAADWPFLLIMWLLIGRSQGDQMAADWSLSSYLRTAQLRGVGLASTTKGMTQDVRMPARSTQQSSLQRKNYKNGTAERCWLWPAPKRDDVGRQDVGQKHVAKLLATENYKIENRIMKRTKIIHKHRQ